MRSNPRMLQLLFVGGVLTMLGGCSPAAKMKTLSVELDGQRLGSSTVSVHLVGVSDHELRDWEAVASSEYWKTDNSLRQSAESEGLVYVMDFGLNRPRTQTLPATDPVWSKWKARSARWLIVLANLTDRSGPSGGRDPFREVIPLHSNRWAGEEIRVQLQPGRVQLQTPPLPVEP